MNGKARPFECSRAVAHQPTARRERHVLVALWMGCEFGRDTLEGIRAELAARGLSWRIRFVNAAVSFDTAVRWMLDQRILDGAISCFAGMNPKTDAALDHAHVPVVCLSREPSGISPVASHGRVAFVALDTASVVRDAVRHFRDRTCFRSFGFVDSRWDDGWSRIRGDACLAELSRLGLHGSRFRPRRRATGAESGGLAEWLRALEKPAAILAANDATAVEVVEVCETAGLSVPRDVAVLGMDDDPAYCQLSTPNLSSVRFDGRAAGRLCVGALTDMMDGATTPERPLLYGALEIAQRASTGAVSTAGALVQKALDFIDANACRGASTADVVRHLGVSRSLATMRFRELRGESILDAIAARRIAEAQRLLSKTDRSLDEIAAACGYAGVGSFRRAFQAAMGTPPGKWRAGHP